VRYGSVCSGIEAASVAWEPLGWQPAWFSEIDPFPSAVLAHRFPGVPNLGDMTTIHEREEFQRGSVDLLVGGTPCQSFSVAGLRAGLDDPRGNLALVFLRLASIARPRWIVWENVPGVLSSNRGRDFGSFIGALAQLGYGWAYRVLDAQYFGVPQRRRRVFVVGCLGDWRASASVLFEPEGVCRDSAKTEQQEQEDSERPAQDSIQGQWWDGSRISQTLDAVLYKRQAMPEKNRFPAVLQDERVRFITPREAERLQGFPDDWTLVPHRRKHAADGPRYKAIGNSMAVPVMRWIGERLSAVDR
jgi:DNA (cytosine-5)-methyltransferase 1